MIPAVPSGRKQSSESESLSFIPAILDFGDENEYISFETTSEASPSVLEKREASSRTGVSTRT
jgi:hypothetical protein